MDVSDRKTFTHAFADAALALSGLEVTLATLRDTGVVSNAQLVEILHRLRGMVDGLQADPETAVHEIVEAMQRRLHAMATFLAVDLRSN
jgi:hypothetical protein